MLRPKKDGRSARFYTLVTRDTLDQDFAANRQRFLAEQGYAYRIMDAKDVGTAGLGGCRGCGHATHNLHSENSQSLGASWEHEEERSRSQAACRR